MTTNPKPVPLVERDSARSDSASRSAPLEEKESLSDWVADRNPDAKAPDRHGDEKANAMHGARIHLVIGPVGAGKSTFALALARDTNAVRLTLDAWMTTLFSPDRPDTGVVEWYRERAARCLDQIWNVTEDLVRTGTSVILEIGLIQRRQRERFHRRVDAAGLELTLHVLDAPRAIRRERVEARNRTRGATFSMVVPPDIFELASDLWEPPDAAECEGRDVHFVDTAVAGESGEGGRGLR